MWVRNLIAIVGIAALAGCQTTSVNTSYHSNYANYDRNGMPVQEQSAIANSNLKDDLWQLTRNNLKFSKAQSKARVKAEIKFYNRYPLHMTKVSAQASPYYHYVLKEVLKRGYPSEVALLPVIESLYNPNAYSYGKASGIWQIIPSTATYLGMTIDNWYDGRRDLIHSTQTALDYLERLNKRFDGDWMLTFAAYNGGGGTVSKAMRINKEKGLATDYWSLKLPKETTHYVPKILAIAALVENPRKYNIELPSIANKPYFNIVKLEGQVDLNKAATLANLDREAIDQLNPGFNRGVTSPNGPFRLLIPVKKAQQLQLALNSLDQSQKMDYTRYKIQPGDNLGSIAQQFGSKVSSIKQANSMTSSKLRIGKTLLIPNFGENKNVAQRNTRKKSTEHKLHKINNGDTVWDIAKKHKLSVKAILAFNGLSKNSTLKIGSSIKIPRG
jgi:membrane-bound lytic murein transglycosylase D